MKSRIQPLLTAVLALGAFALPIRTHGQESKEHHHYKLIAIGTFGGPSSSSLFGDAQSLNNRETVVGQADTSVPDPNFPNFNPYLGQDPFIYHGFRWENGKLTDLGALPGTNDSGVGWINDRGLAVGSSTNSLIDPLTGWPEEVAVLWSQDEIINLGTLGGSESQADAINDARLLDLPRTQYPIRSPPLLVHPDLERSSGPSSGKTE